MDLHCKEVLTISEKIRAFRKAEDIPDIPREYLKLIGRHHHYGTLCFRNNVS
jgi:hypothetical protein